MNIETELKRIETEITDPEQQGYEAAPLICEITGIDPTDLLIHILQYPSGEDSNSYRDVGVVRWCREQLAKKGE